ncbi:MAG: filamentous hemagglutinin N-terminal domain-containing protein [Moorea sp. SIO3C2]|nr:filamentous hemagglutinin N-terminal domain-containing protein [Moorena sp. SIO3C2]
MLPVAILAAVVTPALPADLNTATDDEIAPSPMVFPLLAPRLTRRSQPGVLVAQVTPANDAIGTVVNPVGDQWEITGGQLSDSGTNLFHSFEHFNLDAGQTADFLATDHRIQKCERHGLIGINLGRHPNHSQKKRPKNCRNQNPIRNPQPVP